MKDQDVGHASQFVQGRRAFLLGALEELGYLLCGEMGQTMEGLVTMARSMAIELE